MAVSVRDDRDRHRFVVEVDGSVAHLDYEVASDRLTLIHTEVPHALSGGGIGGQLVRAAVARAAAEGLTIVPRCPFARRWLRGHPDVAATASIDWAAARAR
jgi:predicted GNAT family acetyltransferase